MSRRSDDRRSVRKLANDVRVARNGPSWSLAGINGSFDNIPRNRLRSRDRQELVNFFAACLVGRRRKRSDFNRSARDAFSRTLLWALLAVARCY